DDREAVGPTARLDAGAGVDVGGTEAARRAERGVERLPAAAPVDPPLSADRRGEGLDVARPAPRELDLLARHALDDAAVAHGLAHALRPRGPGVAHGHVAHRSPDLVVAAHALVEAGAGVLDDRDVFLPREAFPTVEAELDEAAL